MGNVYCKKCGIPRSYYSDKVVDRKSCRIKGENDEGIGNYNHKWDYSFNIYLNKIRAKIKSN